MVKNEELIQTGVSAREYLNLVRDRATGSAVKEPRSSATKGDRAGEPGSSGGEPPSSPSRPTRLCYESPASPGRHTAPDSPSKPSQAAAAAEAALERRAAALADRHRAMRKRAKKLRLRLANASGPVAWVRDDDVRSGAVPECDREVGCAPLPACVEVAKPKVLVDSLGSCRASARTSSSRRGRSRPSCAPWVC